MSPVTKTGNMADDPLQGESIQFILNVSIPSLSRSRYHSRIHLDISVTLHAETSSQGAIAVRPLKHHSPHVSPMLYNLVMALCVFRSKTFISCAITAGARDVSPKESIESVPVVSAGKLLTQHDPSQELQGCTRGAKQVRGVIQGAMIAALSVHGEPHPTNIRMETKASLGVLDFLSLGAIVTQATTTDPTQGMEWGSGMIGGREWPRNNRKRTSERKRPMDTS